MTDRTENIIALAELCGLMVIQPLSDDAGECYYQASPDDVLVFNPYESADDCDAVRRKLQRMGYTIYVAIGPMGDGVGTDASSLTWVDDWKEGVCELALKVKEAVAE